MRTIFLKHDTCDAIRKAAAKFGMTAQPRNDHPLAAALCPAGTEPVHLDDAQFDKFERLRKRLKVTADRVAMRLVTA